MCLHQQYIDTTDDEGLFAMRCCECGELFDIAKIDEILKAYFRITSSKSQIKAILGELSKEKRIAELLIQMQVEESNVRGVLLRQAPLMSEPMVEKVINEMRDILRNPHAK